MNDHFKKYLSIEEEYNNACDMFHNVNNEAKQSWSDKADKLEEEMNIIANDWVNKNSLTIEDWIVALEKYESSK